jgi:hypothetical protein
MEKREIKIPVIFHGPLLQMEGNFRFPQRNKLYEEKYTLEHTVLTFIKPITRNIRRRMPAIMANAMIQVATTSFWTFPIKMEDTTTE